MRIFLKIVMVLIVLLIVTFSYSNYSFQRAYNAKVKEIFKDKPLAQGTISKADLNRLPPLMQNYLAKSGLVGKPYVNKVRLEQQGRIRLKPNGKWLSFTAEQYYRLDKPAFVWNTTIKILGIPIIRGMDIYQEGKGYMKIKVLPFFTVVNATGKEVNEGSHSRYLNEIMWFPQMYLSNKLHYQQTAENKLLATFIDSAITTTAELTISENKLLNFECNRWYMADEGNIARKWSTPLNKWGVLSDIYLPLAGHAEWDLDQSKFNYIEITIKDIEYIQ
ncbi:hypothetical protein IMX26_07330 [Clostridium sp. 'deep sea']|uniref:DUF6544 family protein n=1 Tax=Clostridium sp. 'deep sea' TaxID=2779445 RepID=UPI0018967B96|nr:DUF6544 family protein [Clostridium sp. 'deep sea']QOR36611.1 hypothetical protein IMX26_07330 [Clostridium sp. 'deep sea']